MEAAKVVQVKVAVRRKIDQPFGVESGCEIVCLCGKALAAYHGTIFCECGRAWSENGWLQAEASKPRIVAEMAEALERIAGELQMWESSGLPRPATWARTRIALAQAALRKARGETL